MTTPTHNALSSRLKRRRALPLASTATVLGIAGCALSGHSPAPSTTDSVQATRLVQNYTSDIEMALDKVDRERLRTAAEKKSPTIVQVKTSTTTETLSPFQDPSPQPSGQPATDPSATLTASAVAPPPAPALIPQASAAIFKPAPSKTAPEPTVTVAPTPLTSPPQATITPASPETPTPAATPKPVVSSTAVASAAVPNKSPAPSPRVASMDTQSPMAVLVASPLLFPDNDSPFNGISVASSSEALTPPSPSSSDTAADTPSASAMAAMTAMAVPQTPDPAAAPAAEASLDEALAVLRRNVGTHPTLSTALALALLDNKVGGTAGGGGDLIESLAPADQKVAADLLAALSAMKPASPGTTVSDRAAPLLDAAAKWQADADLSLPRMVLASRVDSFGVFTEIPATFEQGKRHTVIIYCEVANFGSQKDGDWYATRLSQQESLITEDGLLVWRPNPEDIEDRSRNQRHDFYLVKKLTLPETLAAGKYTLRMTVTDKTKNKTSVINRPLEIVLK